MIPKKVSQEKIQNPGDSFENIEDSKKKYNKYIRSPSIHWTNLRDPQEQRVQQRALFTLKKSAKQIIVTQEYKMLSCMLLIHLVKINTLKVR